MITADSCPIHYLPIHIICGRQECLNLYCSQCFQEHIFQFNHCVGVKLNQQSKLAFIEWNRNVVEKLHNLVSLLKSKTYQSIFTIKLHSNYPEQKLQQISSLQINTSAIEVLQKQCDIISNNTNFVVNCTNHQQLKAPEFLRDLYCLFIQNVSENLKFLSENLKVLLLEKYQKKQIYKFMDFEINKIQINKLQQLYCSIISKQDFIVNKLNSKQNVSHENTLIPISIITENYQNIPPNKDQTRINLQTSCESISINASVNNQLQLSNHSKFQDFNQLFTNNNIMKKSHDRVQLLLSKQEVKSYDQLKQILLIKEKNIFQLKDNNRHLIERVYSLENEIEKKNGIIFQDKKTIEGLKNQIQIALNQHKQLEQTVSNLTQQLFIVKSQYNESENKTKYEKASRQFFIQFNQQKQGLREQIEQLQSSIDQYRQHENNLCQHINFLNLQKDQLIIDYKKKQQQYQNKIQNLENQKNKQLQQLGQKYTKIIHQKQLENDQIKIYYQKQIYKLQITMDNNYQQYQEHFKNYQNSQNKYQNQIKIKNQFINQLKQKINQLNLQIQNIKDKNKIKKSNIRFQTEQRVFTQNSQDYKSQQKNQIKEFEYMIEKEEQYKRQQNKNRLLILIQEQKKVIEHLEYQLFQSSSNQEIEQTQLRKSTSLAQEQQQGQLRQAKQYISKLIQQNNTLKAENSLLSKLPTNFNKDNHVKTIPNEQLLQDIIQLEGELAVQKNHVKKLVEFIKKNEKCKSKQKDLRIKTQETKKETI